MININSIILSGEVHKILNRGINRRGLPVANFLIKVNKKRFGEPDGSYVLFPAVCWSQDIDDYILEWEGGGTFVFFGSLSSELASKEDMVRRRITILVRKWMKITAASHVMVDIPILEEIIENNFGIMENSTDSSKIDRENEDVT